MVVLGISNDKVEDNLEFAREYQFPFDLLSDINNYTALAYGAVDDLNASSHRRMSFVIDPQGRIERIYSEVDAEKHAEKVLSQLC